MSDKPILVNRAPVLTLWGAAVAERMGYDPQTALTLGKALSGLTAQSKGRSLGIYHSGGGHHRAGKTGPTKKDLGEDTWVEICGRQLPAKHTEAGLRAVVKDDPIDPGQVERYLKRAFGDSLSAAREAMQALARSYEPEELERRGFELYEAFRPQVPPGEAGWGRRGELDLGRIQAMAGGDRTAG